MCKEAGQPALQPMAEARIWLELGSQPSWRSQQHPEACFCITSPQYLSRICGGEAKTCSPAPRVLWGQG